MRAGEIRILMGIILTFMGAMIASYPGMFGWGVVISVYGICGVFLARGA